MPEFGVISGSGLYDIAGLEITGTVKVDTPYGIPSDDYRVGTLSGREVAFLPRHGSPHRIPPHKINYRANIRGFQEMGVKKILSIGASGGISGEMKPGAIAVLDQLIDITGGRQGTFYEADEVVHIDFTDPFCPDLRRLIFEASERTDVQVCQGGTYICVNGPRLETAAEIRAFSLWGADLVGMTLAQEAALAREAEICFAGLSVVTNFAAGTGGKKLTVTEVVDTMRSSNEKISLLLGAFFAASFPRPTCSCGHALKDARM